MSSGKIKRCELVADRLHSSAIHLLRRVRVSDSELGLSPSRLSALSVLVFAGDKTLGELAQAEQVKPPTITKLVQALETAGLVRRIPVAHDKRATRVQATPQGRRTLHQGRRSRVRTLAKLLKSLTADDLAMLAEASELIERIVAGEQRTPSQSL